MHTASRAFDAAASERVDRIYQNQDIVTQRRIMLKRLAIKRGDHILDIGCGPGLLALDIANSISPVGAIIGVDPSAEMRALAKKRCRGVASINIVDGDAVKLPCDTSSLDIAIATQVYEYVAEIENALLEAYRVLKPGGRIAIIDTDWDSVVMHTFNRKRMHAVMEIHRDHFVHPDLPGKLPSLLVKTGFSLTYAGTIPIINMSLSPENFCGDVLRGLAKRAQKNNHLGPVIADAWLEELETLDKAGEFFFSVTRFFFIAAKPH